MKPWLKLLMVVSFAVAILCAAETGQSLFQKALTKERADADPAGAIVLYERVVKEFSGDRKLAAEALFRIGECHLALGHAEARKAFERLVREFSDQAELASNARTKLAALAAPEAKPKFTKIRVPTKLPVLSEKALSPDGQQLAYVDGGSVWVVQVHGASSPEIAGLLRRLTAPIPAWKNTVEIVWSRDAKWIALNVVERLQDDLEEEAIYIVPSAGGQPQKVPLELKNYAGTYEDYGLGLSPDGSWLAYTTFKAGEDAAQPSVYLAPTKGGTTRRLTRPPSREPAFSPDGKRMAYVGLIKGWERDPDRLWGQQVWVTPIDGGSPALVYQSPRAERLWGPTWSPDGKMLAFTVGTSPGDEGRGIVFVPLGTDGRAAGSPTRIELRDGTNSKLAGWSSDNQIAVMFSAPELYAIYTVPISGGQAVQLTSKPAQMPSWTPDGKRIFFDGMHGDDEWPSIEFIPAAGGKVTRIPLRGPFRIGMTRPGRISISPDGKKILFAGDYIPRGAGFSVRIFAVTIEGGEVTEIPTGGRDAYYPGFSPDGRAIAFLGDEEIRKNVRLCNIYRIPVEGGESRPLTSQADKVMDATIAWSPNGKDIAFYSEDNKLKLAGAEGGPSKVLVEGLRGYRRDSGLVWSPDGKELAYITQGKIFRLNLESGKSEEVPTGLADAHLMQMTWSPDGSTIAFSAKQGGEPELWLMSDFLPLLEAGRYPERHK